MCAITAWVRDVDGVQCVWLQHDFTFFGGSLGSAEGASAPAAPLERGFPVVSPRAPPCGAQHCTQRWLAERSGDHAGEKITCGFEYAFERGLPVVLECQSGKICHSLDFAVDCSASTGLFLPPGVAAR